MRGRGRYIVVEGVIGVGKTTLVNKLANENPTHTLLEVVEGNPFLVDGFYKDTNRYAFDTQCFFLLSRFRQQRGIESILNAHDKQVVSDYLFDKDQIFARLNLSDEDYAIYESVYRAFAKEVTKPDLVVYLRSGVEMIMRKIQMRDRQFERDIEQRYIERLAERYDYFFTHYEESPKLIIDVDEMDYVKQADDYRVIRQMIEQKLNGIWPEQSVLSFMK